jgi:GNAT superfamily N-acetyltransferase
MHVRLRDLRPDEQQTVQAVFDGLSTGSRYRRFHGPVDRLTPGMREVLAAADGCDHVVIVAEAGRGRRRRPVGLARLVRTDSTTAELAMEVVDAAQGHGIGRRLLSAIRLRAIEIGVHVIVADVLEDNEPMLHLLRGSFTGIRTTRDRGGWHLRCPVPTLELEPADLYPALAEAA